MNISRLCIKRAGGHLLAHDCARPGRPDRRSVLAGFLAAGRRLSDHPGADFPTPRASPQVMATTVTAPLEVQLGQIPSLTQMTSASSAGASVITLQFNLGSQPRRRRAGRSAGYQRGKQLAAERRAAGATGLCEG